MKVDVPFEIGQPVWFVRDKWSKAIEETLIEKIIIKSGGIYLKLACNSMYETSCKSIGKTIFFSKEAAEEAFEKLHRKKF